MIALVIMYVVVAFGLLAAVRNPTAAALVVAWAIPQGLWIAGGSNLPIGLFRLLDIGVIAIIFLKPERSKWDWRIIGIFGIEWCVYSANFTDFTEYWLLWALTILQFSCAFAEAAGSYSSLKQSARLWGRNPPGWFFSPGGSHAGR